jgi:hypothetical protein
MKIFNPYDKRSLIKKILGYCDCPCHQRHWFVYPKVIRCNTMCENETDNWVVCCEEFYENEIEPQIEEMWHEYYNSRL